jgi:hypothetical protein
VCAPFLRCEPRKDRAPERKSTPRPPTVALNCLGKLPPQPQSQPQTHPAQVTPAPDPSRANSTPPCGKASKIPQPRIAIVIHRGPAFRRRRMQFNPPATPSRSAHHGRAFREDLESRSRSSGFPAILGPTARATGARKAGCPHLPHASETVKRVRDPRWQEQKKSTKHTKGHENGLCISCPFVCSGLERHFSPSLKECPSRSG